jgi:peptidoglycan/LPS O-acetylase OafA/YrhL
MATFDSAPPTGKLEVVCRIDGNGQRRALHCPICGWQKSDMQKEQLRALTGLRFLLAIWVVVYHRTAGYAQTVPHPLFYMAVGIFFSLSGFILAYNYNLENNWDLQQLRKFALARFARIYPVYALGLLLVVHFQLRAFLRQPAPQTAFGVLQFTLLQAWIPAATGMWNSPGWSLSNEAFFYALFPFLGVALWRCTKLTVQILIVAALWAGAMSVPCLVVVAHVPGVNFGATADNHHSFLLDLIRYNPLLHLPEFLIGVLGCRIFLDVKQNWAGRGYYFYTPGIFLFGSAITFATLIPYTVLHDGLADPAVLLIVVGLALGGGLVDRVLSNRVLVFLGTCSYSMYILHLPILAWLQKLHFLSLTSGRDIMLSILIIIAISSVIFVSFEEPLNLIVKGNLKNRLARNSSPLDLSCRITKSATK